MPVPRPEHPRPDFMRAPWVSLNGPWEFAFDDEDVGEGKQWWREGAFPETITVPFSFESPASGIGDTSIHTVCWYRRSFSLPPAFAGMRVRLNFGAVDYHAKAWVNGMLIGEHEGGYVPFAFDITPALVRGENTLVVRVHDDVALSQPRGKQSPEPDPSGTRYTRCTGIWQPVWLEGVGDAFIESLRVTTDVQAGVVNVRAAVRGPAGAYQFVAKITEPNGNQILVRREQTLSGEPGDVFEFHERLGEPALWSPDHPDLYGLRLEVRRGQRTHDAVDSYFGMREVAARDGKIWLNGKPIYQRLALDQGYFPGGIYTPETDEAIRRDIELAKACGFNGVRKHQKVEDPRFLYWADRLGFLVWGEMANTFEFSELACARLEREWRDVVRRDRNHPCVIVWTPFNESWGVPGVGEDAAQQAFVERTVALTRAEDPTLPVCDNSGWEHVTTDVCDVHDYAEAAEEFGRAWADFTLDSRTMPKRHKETWAKGRRYAGQPVVISEYGGIGMKQFPPAEGKKLSVYGTYMESPEAFLARYRATTQAILDHPALWGFCYTQLTDIEGEVNGVLTFDRRPKVEPRLLAEINQGRSAAE